MKLKRLIALTLASAMFLTACSSSEETTTEETQTTGEIVTTIDAPVEITFWHAMNAAQEEALTKLTEDFMAANKNITVTLQNQSSYGELSQKLTATMQSPDSLPTITQAYPGWVYNAMQDGFVTDLAPYITNETIGIADYETDFVEGFRNGVNYDGKIYGMPFNKSTEVIWYNVELFEELGLTPPTTMEELATTAKAITDAKGIVGAGFDSLNNYYVTYLVNNGITFEPGFEVTGDVSTEAVNFYLDGIKDGSLRIAGTDGYLSDPFKNELVGMFIGSTAGETYATGENFTTGVAPYPAETAIQQGTDVYMFNTGTQEQQTAAFLYLSYLTSTESQVYWGVQTGYIPVRNSALTSTEYTESGALVPTVLADATASMYTSPVVPGGDPAYQETKTVMEQILALPDSAVVADELANFEATLNTLW